MQRAGPIKTNGMAALRVSILAIVTVFFSCRTDGFLRPIDRSDMPIKVTKIKGHVYLVEDFNYWKTNSVFYAAPEGIVFIDATWNPKTASQVIWKAATFSTADFLAVIVTSYGLHHTGGLAQFRRDGIPVHMRRSTIKLAREKWDAMQTDMASFGSWRAYPITDGDSYFEERTEYLGGRVIVFSLPAAHTPDNVGVYFPEERVLYAGSVISDPIYFDHTPDPEKYGKAYSALREWKPEIVISGHGDPLPQPLILNRFPSSSQK